MTGGYYDSRDQRQRIRILQRMLRAVADRESWEGEIPRETGQYDDVTRGAVRQFQRRRGWPETGVADRRTWEEMSRLYREWETERTEPERIRPFVGRGRRIRARERSDLVMILQLMLNELRIRPFPVSMTIPRKTRCAPSSGSICCLRTERPMCTRGTAWHSSITMC